MVIKVFISGISGSKEVKKRQQRALLILDSCKVEYESIDITEPGMEESREFMQTKSTVRPPNRTPIAPQFFNDDEYCGDYEDFDAAVEVNKVLFFLKLESEAPSAEVILNNEEEKVIENGINHSKKDENEPETNASEQKEDTKQEESTNQVDEESGEKKEEEEEEEEEEEGEGEKLSKAFPLERDEEADVWGDISQEETPKKRKKGESGGSELDEERSTVLLGDTTEDSWGSLGETSKRLKVEEEEGSDFFWNEQSNESKTTPLPEVNKSGNEEDEGEEEEEEEEENE